MGKEPPRLRLVTRSELAPNWTNGLTSFPRTCRIYSSSHSRADCRIFRWCQAQRVIGHGARRGQRKLPRCHARPTQNATLHSRKSTHMGVAVPVSAMPCAGACQTDLADRRAGGRKRHWLLRPDDALLRPRLQSSWGWTNLRHSILSTSSLHGLLKLRA